MPTQIIVLVIFLGGMSADDAGKPVTTRLKERSMDTSGQLVSDASGWCSTMFFQGTTAWAYTRVPDLAGPGPSRCPWSIAGALILRNRYCWG